MINIFNILNMFDWWNPTARVCQFISDDDSMEIIDILIFLPWLGDNSNALLHLFIFMNVK